MTLLLRLVSLLLLAIVISGCLNTQKRSENKVPKRSFTLKNITKSDVDMVAETQLRLSMKLLLDLSIKLYKRNPYEWRKAGYANAEQAAQAIFSGARQDLSLLGGAKSIAAIRLTFNDNFYGDRVLAFSYGLRTMLIKAYGNKQEFNMLDSLDPQKLYNSARNLEIAAWKLNHDRDRSGNLYLISNQLSGPVTNLSYERNFGKLIALQDSMALIIADKTNRTIKNVIQSVAKMVFLPI